MDQEANKETTRKFIEALGRDDRSSLRSLVSQRVTWHSPPMNVARGLPPSYVGWDNVPWLAGRGSTAFRPGTTTWTIHHLVAEDDLVVAHANRKALTSNGQLYDNEYYWLFRFEGGQILEIWEMGDTYYASTLISWTDYGSDPTQRKAE
jgi:ketosteroid isomerase-like protein